MSGPLKTLRFKLAWQGYRVGDEVTPNGVLRDWLMANGYCELVEHPAALLPDKKPGVKDKAKVLGEARGALMTRQTT